MNRLVPADDNGLAAFDSGRTCAAAAQGQRDLQSLVTTYPGLFPSPPFDGSVFSTLAMANAFSAPTLTAPALRVVNRASLWAFRVDWLFDHVARSRTELVALARRCVAVAAGATPEADDTLGLFLADIRADLEARPGFAELSEAWVEELDRMFAAMLREWDWKAAGERPTVAAYLANADNLGASFVDLSHWLANPEPGSVHSGAGDLAAVLAATRATQRIIRVINDLASIERDRRSGDLNLLLLTSDLDPTALTSELTAEGESALSAVRDNQCGLADFLHRQVEFCRGFYGRTDYWGDV